MKKIISTLVVFTMMLIGVTQTVQAMRASEATVFESTVQANINIEHLEDESIIMTYENNQDVAMDAISNATQEETVDATPEVEEFITSSPDITLSYEYVQSDVMPYILYTPSTAETNEKTPLIISLHGMGDRGTSAANFENKFISKMLKNWPLEGFNAYVMIPHLSGAGYAETWNAQYVAEKLFAIIDQVVEECNIDTDRIIIQGQSMGGYGCLYMAAYHPEYFSAVVPISAYNSKTDLSKLEGIPFRAYVGSKNYGEDGNSEYFVMNTLVNVFGAENVNQRLCSHDEIPIMAFEEDLNEDGKSDLIEWMLAQNKSDRER